MRTVQSPAKSMAKKTIMSCTHGKRMVLSFAFIVLLFLIAAGSAHAKGQIRRQQLVPHHISLASGRSFDLNLPRGFAISVAAQGLKRVRFMAKSPDDRIFVTDMYNLADNNRGVVYILDEFDDISKSFKKATPYLKGLRNPNSIAFYTDAKGVNWFYLALTDHLVRYKYKAGEETPQGQPEVLASFPDYGLSYKYGGWHLTRTIAVGSNDK